MPEPTERKITEIILASYLKEVDSLQGEFTEIDDIKFSLQALSVFLEKSKQDLANIGPVQNRFIEQDTQILVVQINILIQQFQKIIDSYTGLGIEQIRNHPQMYILRFTVGVLQEWCTQHGYPDGASPQQVLAESIALIFMSPLSPDIFEFRDEAISAIEKLKNPENLTIQEWADYYQKYRSAMLWANNQRVEIENYRAVKSLFATIVRSILRSKAMSSFQQPVTGSADQNRYTEPAGPDNRVIDVTPTHHALRTQEIDLLTVEEQELLRTILASQNSEVSQKVDDQVREAILLISKQTYEEVDAGAPEPPAYKTLDEQIRSESLSAGREYNLNYVLTRRLDEIKEGALEPLKDHQRGGSARFLLLHDPISRPESYGSGDLGLLPWQAAVALVFPTDIALVEPMAAINPTEKLPSVTGSDKAVSFGVQLKYLTTEELGRLHDIGLKITLKSGVEYQLFYNTYFDVADAETPNFVEFALVSKGMLVAQDRIPDKANEKRPKQTILFVP